MIVWIKQPRVIELSRKDINCKQERILVKMIYVAPNQT